MWHLRKILQKVQGVELRKDKNEVGRAEFSVWSWWNSAHRNLKFHLLRSSKLWAPVVNLHQERPPKILNFTYWDHQSSEFLWWICTRKGPQAAAHLDLGSFWLYHPHSPHSLTHSHPDWGGKIRIFITNTSSVLTIPVFTPSSSCSTDSEWASRCSGSWALLLTDFLPTALKKIQLLLYNLRFITSEKKGFFFFFL